MLEQLTVVDFLLFSSDERGADPVPPGVSPTRFQILWSEFQFTFSFFVTKCLFYFTNSKPQHIFPLKLFKLHFFTATRFVIRVMFIREHRSKMFLSGKRKQAFLIGQVHIVLPPRFLFSDRLVHFVPIEHNLGPLCTYWTQPWSDSKALSL